MSWAVGTVITVYRRAGSVDEVCNLGCTHAVKVIERKTLTLTSVEAHMIPFLNYDSPGVGNVWTATDPDGMVWTATPSWEGPGMFRCPEYPEDFFSVQKPYYRGYPARDLLTGYLLT